MQHLHGLNKGNTHSMKCCYKNLDIELKCMMQRWSRPQSDEVLVKTNNGLIVFCSYDGKHVYLPQHEG